MKQNTRSWETLGKGTKGKGPENTQTGDEESGNSRGTQLEQTDVTKQGKQKWTQST